MTEIVFAADQLGMALSIILFMYFFYWGYTSEKSNAGAFIVVSGLLLISSVAPIFTYVLSSGLLIVAAGVFIILIGINKWFFSKD